MIGSLRGRLLHRDVSGEVLIEVGGIGYRVQVAPRLLGVLGEEGEEVFVFVHHHCREDGQTLYGFVTLDERACFEALISAHGVGPSLAQAILTVHSPDELRCAVADANLDALSLVPGIGKKTAARLVLELKSKLDVAVDLDALASGATGTRSTSGAPARSTIVADVRDALAGLGYGPDEVRDAVNGLPADGDAASLLREALRRLAATR